MVDAIKWFNNHYNSTITILVDFKENKSEQPEIYKSVENDEPDCRGYFNHSFYDSKNNLIYNEDEATAPIVKLIPDKFTNKTEDGYIDRDGNFYECGYECHRYLAEELFISNTVKKKELEKGDNYEDFLDERGWVKISSSEIHYRSFVNDKPVRLTNSQKQSIINYIETCGKEQYKFQYKYMSIDEIKSTILFENK